MPVPLAGMGPHRVAGVKLNGRLATRLHEPDTLEHVQSLSHGVGMPGGPGSRGEVHRADAHAGGRLPARDDVEPDVAGEHVGTALR